jgi:type I restriction enzyme S subunit
LSKKEADAFLLEPEDLLFARQSLVLEGAGKCSLFVGDSEPVTFESHLIRARLNRNIADPRFYYYFFGSRPGRNLIETIVEQVAAAGIRGNDLSKLSVPFPVLDDQRAISRILGALDDKIELNRLMNHTMETMAHALFKSWFVDFDPVTAKAAGRKPYGLNEATAALFPDHFVESDLGLIPDGWQIMKVGDFV